LARWACAENPDRGERFSLNLCVVVKNALAEQHARFLSVEAPVPLPPQRLHEQAVVQELVPRRRTCAGRRSKSPYLIAPWS
jgi:hypothetical protein